MTEAAPDAKVFEFLGKALSDVSGAAATLMAAVGDRLGLFQALAAAGPCTSEELAQRAGVGERYSREWLAGLSAAGYLTYDAAAGRYALPPEREPVLVREGGPFFFGGLYEMLTSLAQVLDPLEEAFRTGGGVPQSAYSARTWSGMERFSAGMYENVLVQEFIPSVPEVEAALQRGADVADVGCGSGRALIKLAEAYPRSRFVGYDIFPAQLERARRAVTEAGLDARIKLELADASRPFPEAFDVITTFDVVHDARDPLSLLRSIRDALRIGGYYLCLDVRSSEEPGGNTGEIATLFYAFSLMYCMTTSLAEGGAGLGALGLHESKLRDLALEAGFGSVERAPVDNPFNDLWVLRP